MDDPSQPAAVPPPAPRVAALSVSTWLFAAALALYAVVVLRHAWISDDAYITFRTVRNFVSGHGLRWNLIERVQGYTHPLWMFALSLGYLLTGRMYGTAIWLAIGCSVFATWLVGRRVATTPAAGLAALAVLVSSKSFVDYSTSGLENPLTHVLLLLFLLRAASDARLWVLSLLAALIATNRLDAFVFCLPVLVVAAWRTRRDRRACLQGLLGFLPLALWELFSLVYYGFPFPNTAYAKLGAGILPKLVRKQGMAYFVSELSFDPLAVFVIAAALASVVVLRARHLYATALGLVLYLVYIQRIGGDFMAGRFFAAPLLVAVFLLCRAAPNSTASEARAWPALAVLAIGFVVTPRPTLASSTAYAATTPPSEGVWDVRGVSDERAFYYPSTGLLRLSRNVEAPLDDRPTKGRRLLPGKAAALGQIGAIAFFAPETAIVVDGHGLTDPLVARLPLQRGFEWRPGHLLRRIPDGYLATLESGVVKLTEPRLAEYYTHLHTVVAGPLFTAQRWREILAFNLGRYDGLIDRERDR